MAYRTCQFRPQESHKGSDRLRVFKKEEPAAASPDDQQFRNEVLAVVLAVANIRLLSSFPFFFFFFFIFFFKNLCWYMWQLSLLPAVTLVTCVIPLFLMMRPVTCFLS